MSAPTPTLHSQELRSDVDKLSNNGYEEDFGKGTTKGILERAEVRSKSVVDSFLKQREKLKKLQLELTVARFGLSLLGWFEAYQSSVSFGRVEFGVVDTRRSVDDMHSNVGGLKSTISTSFDQFQTVSDEFCWKMAELEASVAMAEVNRETEYRGSCLWLLCLMLGIIGLTPF